MTLFARKMGPAEVAAWGIIGYVWSAFETITGTREFLEYVLSKSQKVMQILLLPYCYCVWEIRRFW